METKIKHTKKIDILNQLKHNKKNIIIILITIVLTTTINIIRLYMEADNKWCTVDTCTHTTVYIYKKTTIYIRKYVLVIIIMILTMKMKRETNNFTIC